MRGRQVAEARLVDRARHARLDVGGEHERLVDVELHVHDADLDGAEARMRPHVPPEVGVVVDHAGLLHRADHLEVVVVRREARRLARARHAREDRRARRCEARGLAAPERRAGREREQHRQLGEQALHDMHREVRIRHGHVHVHPEHELAARDVLQLLDEPAVAVARRDALILRARERCAPAPASRMPSGSMASVMPRRTLSRSVRSSSTLRQTTEATSSVLCISSGCARPSSGPPSSRSATSSKRETSSNVVASRSMYSSSTPTVRGSPLPNVCSAALVIA